MKLYVDDEPLLLATADLDHYERVLDFRTGVSYRDVVWRTPGGKRIQVRSERLVSFHHRHLAMMLLEFTMLDAGAPVVVSSQLHEPPGRRGRVPRSNGGTRRGSRPASGAPVPAPRAAAATAAAPRRSGDGRRGPARLPVREQRDDARVRLPAPAADVEPAHDRDHRRGRPRQDRLHHRRAPRRDGSHRQARRVPLVDRACPAEELADRCHRTLARARTEGPDEILAQQRAWLDEYWFNSDVEVRGDEPAQQAVRWNLFQLAQASARTQEQGIAAKGVTGGGYDGHYFWDTEVYVIPFLAYTSPDVARKLLRFRWRMLPAARRRAAELSQVGALYPWRTINGEEASAYYAAGTAQYHINAAVAYALERYLNATGDVDFLIDEGAEMMVETARLWEDLGFYATNGDGSFHIHSVTGPDEYTTVVNDNTYTNMMARFNLSLRGESGGVPRRLGDGLVRPAPAAHRARPQRNRGVASRRRGDVHPLRRGARHPPPGRQLPRARAVGLRAHAARPLSPAAPLPPARDLPLPGAEAGRRGARDVPAHRALHA